MRRLIVTLGGLAIAGLVVGCAPAYYGEPEPYGTNYGYGYGPGYYDGGRWGHERHEEHEHEEHEEHEHGHDGWGHHDD